MFNMLHCMSGMLLWHLLFFTQLVMLITGYHLWNADLRTDDNPLEAGMDFICRDEGDYVGKDALDLIKQKGLKKKLGFFQLRE